MKRIPGDLLFVLIWTIFTVIFIIIPSLKDSFIRTILGIPVVLIIPGYVTISALFPKKDDLEVIERIALSFGMSIAIVPLIGLGLNYTPFGIRLIPILISLTVYIIILIILGIYRRENVAEKERFIIPFHKIYSDIIDNIHKPRSKIDTILTIALLLSIVTVIGLLIFVMTIPKVGEKFTEFYILNSTTEKADNYNSNLKINKPAIYLVGVVNHEYRVINYTVDASIGGKILYSKNLSIDNNQEWEYNITIVPEIKGDNMKLEFLLFKENNFTTPYRELHLWVNAS